VFPAGDGTYFPGETQPPLAVELATQVDPVFPAGDGTYYPGGTATSEIVLRLPYHLFVGPTAPSDPEVNDIWIDTSA
jgi:hypothetical protein